MAFLFPINNMNYLPFLITNFLRIFSSGFLFGVPKNRISRSRGRIRRHYRRVAKGPKPTPYRICPTCDQPVRLHYICMNCYHANNKKSETIYKRGVNETNKIYKFDSKIFAKKNSEKSLKLAHKVNTTKNSEKISENALDVDGNNKTSKVTQLFYYKPAKYHFDPPKTEKADPFQIKRIYKAKKKRLSDLRSERVETILKQEEHDKRKNTEEYQNKTTDYKDRNRHHFIKKIEENVQNILKQNDKEISK
ncbi:hypothetical protein MHBO_002597 [Bonamia ostreae]|uniref:50S ribosomal protein L32, chloroplastic n=1 Tax=Bonamia ostreae TaxID=126728 RepID=A0ABV2ANU3_9EUKA